MTAQKRPRGSTSRRQAQPKGKAPAGTRATPRANQAPPDAKPETPRAPIRAAMLSAPKPDAEPSVFAEIAEPKKRRYLEALATTPSVGDAARLAGISVRTGYTFRHDVTDEPFQAALQVAQEMGLHRAEDEGWRRGIEGWEEPVFQGGRLVGTKRVKSDTMLIFMMKGNAPKYRDRMEQILQNPDGSALAALFYIPQNGRPSNS